MRDRSHDEAMIEYYRKNPAFALDLLNDILEDGDQAELLVVLRRMAKAFGGVQSVAEAAHLNPTQLYRTLSAEGNPALDSFTAILKAIGLRMTFQPISEPWLSAPPPPPETSPETPSSKSSRSA